MALREVDMNAGGAFPSAYRTPKVLKFNDGGGAQQRAAAAASAAIYASANGENRPSTYTTNSASGGCIPAQSRGG